MTDLVRVGEVEKRMGLVGSSTCFLSVCYFQPFKSIQKPRKNLNKPRKNLNKPRRHLKNPGNPRPKSKNPKNPLKPPRPEGPGLASGFIQAHEQAAADLKDVQALGG